MVQTCVVNGCKKESYPGCGISFHRLPVNEDLKNKWIQALQLSKKFSKHAVICSLHFKDEDFLTQAKKRLKPEAVPSVLPKRTDTTTDSPWFNNLEYNVSPGPSEELRACRVCLETDTKLFNLHQYQLAQSFGDLTGTPVSPTDGLPQHICEICGHLLQKSVAFRALCRQAHMYLQDMMVQMPQITTEYIGSLNTSRFKLPLTVTDTQVLNVPEDSAADNNYNYISKIETDIKDDLGPKIYDDQCILDITNDTELDVDETYDFSILFDGENLEDNSINYDDVLSTDDVITIDDDDDVDIDMHKKITKLSDKKRKHNIKDEEDIDLEIDNKIAKNSGKKRKRNTKVEEDIDLEIDDKIAKHYYVSASNDPNVDHDYARKTNRKLFYNYVLNKYIHRTKIHEPMDADICDLENVDLNKSSDNQLVTNTHPDKDMFYNFIRQKYIEKNNHFKTKKTFDVTKMHNVKNMVNKINEIREKELTVSTFREDGRSKSKQEWDDFAKTYNFEISRLSKEEQIKKMQARKESDKYVKSIYKCEYCYRGFASREVYMDHMAVHDPSYGSLECDICHMRFKKSGRWRAHSYTHKWRFMCKTCNMTFTDSASAKQHHRQHQGTLFECEHCCKTFRRYKTRVEHVRFHHSRTPCDICYLMFQGGPAVTMHKSLTHKQTFLCSSCNLHFDNQLALDRHRDASSDNACDPKMSPCRKCGEIFTNEEQLAYHIENEHSTRPKRIYPNAGTKKKCCSCRASKRIKFSRVVRERTYPDGNDVERTYLPDEHYEDSERNSPLTSEHNQLRVEANSYDEQLECDSPLDVKCSKLYKEGRVEQDEGERTCPCVGTERERSCPCNKHRSRVMCEMCGRSFPCAAVLRIHQRVHTGEKPYQCSYCDKRYRSKVSFKAHVRIHTDERPFKCQHCEKTFAYQGNVQRHKHLVHTKVRPYICDICGKTFQQSNNLKTHVQAVHMRIPTKPRIRNKKKSQ